MKTLIYGMQSSGATLFAYFMGQEKESIVIMDLLNRNISPYFEYDKVVLKCVVTTLYTWEQHFDSFKPDKTILFVRNPFDNYISLKSKAWYRDNGSILEKLEIMDKEFAQLSKFDAVIHYEDLIENPEDVVKDLKSLGFHVDISFLDFSRRIEDMAVFNHIHAPDYCTKDKLYYQKGKFGKGKIHIITGSLLNKKYVKKNIDNIEKDIQVEIKRICPSLCEFYRG